jgi:hypothetical protein
MDDDTKSRFDAVEGRLDGIEGKLDGLIAALDRRFASVDARFTNIDGRFDSLAKLIEDNSDSLQREMATHVDRLEAAMGRNTKVLAGGSKTVAALTQWADKRDQLDRKRDQEIRDPRVRIQKLERGSKRRAS